MLTGTWFREHSSRATPARCRVGVDGSVRITALDDERLLHSDSIHATQVSTRVGDTQRYLAFPGAGKFETADNDAVDRLLGHFRRGRVWALVHALENRRHYLLAGLAVVVLVVWLGVAFGVPAVARWAAAAIPPAVAGDIDRHTLATLDQAMLGPSRLDDRTHANVLQRLRPHLPQDSPLAYRILLRHGGKVEANAFALPGGTIVFTDEMVELARDDNELICILHHEVAHVIHRHGLRSLVQGSLVAVLALAVTGDLSGSSSLLAALPAFLVEMHYSRDFEREADAYALEQICRRGISSRHFVNIMHRVLEAERARHPEAGARMSGYFSSHPDPGERLALFEQAAARCPQTAPALPR